MQSLERRAERALKDLKSCFITKKQLKNILSLAHLEKKTDDIFKVMNDDYLKRLRLKSLANCGIEGVPKDIAISTLETIGLTPQSINEMYAAIQNGRKVKKNGQTNS